MSSTADRKSVLSWAWDRYSGTDRLVVCNDSENRKHYYIKCDGDEVWSVKLRGRSRNVDACRVHPIELEARAISCESSNMLFYEFGMDLWKVDYSAVDKAIDLFQESRYFTRVLGGIYPQPKIKLKVVSTLEGLDPLLKDALKRGAICLHLVEGWEPLHLISFSFNSLATLLVLPYDTFVGIAKMVSHINQTADITLDALLSEGRIEMADCPNPE